MKNCVADCFYPVCHFRTDERPGIRRPLPSSISLCFSGCGIVSSFYSCPSQESPPSCYLPFEQPDGLYFECVYRAPRRNFTPVVFSATR